MKKECEMAVLKTEISVLMSIYNETLQDISTSVHSVLSQTVPDFELIIVNDNPERKDHLALLNELQAQDKRIVILHNPKNIGLAASMNRALEFARAPYIARMDADDYSLPTRFEKELKLLRGDENDVVFTNYALIGADGLFLEEGKPACQIAEGQDLTELIVFNGVVHHPTVMMKTDALKRVSGYRIFPCSQDQDLWIRMLEAGARFAFLDEILLHYRIRTDSISQKKGLQQYATIEYILRLLKERSEHAGLDSYSQQNYERYIALKCNDTKEIDRFNQGMQCLKAAGEAKEDQKARKWMLRIKAFCISKTLREEYVFKLNNRKQILAYLNNCRK